MPLKLRAAETADSSALSDILRRATAALDCPQDKLNETCRAWQAPANRAPQITVAERDGRPVAFSGYSNAGTEAINVDVLVVTPEDQNKGLGSLLLRRLEDEARFKNRSRLLVETNGTATSFYEKHGFRQMASQPNSPLAGNDVIQLEKLLPPAVHKLEKLDVRRSPQPWPFETENLTAINAHFEQLKQQIPQLWNGRTLKLTGYTFQDGAFTGICSECSFAAFLAWRDWGAPDASAHNMFGSAILRTADGALLFGVMAPHTASAGKIYPPGGNLDPADLTDGNRVDVIGAIYRELEEETGLTHPDVEPGSLLTTFDGPRISIAKIFDVNASAVDLRKRIIRFSMASEEQELSDVRIIRSRDDLTDPAIVPFARAIAEHLLP